LVGNTAFGSRPAPSGSYATVLSATNAATTAAFGRPQQIDDNAYVPRQARLGFRLGF